MALTEQKDSFKLNYNPDIVWDAIKEMEEKTLIFMNLGVTCKEILDETKTIVYKAGTSLKSWGEIITVRIEPSDNGTTVMQVISAPKTGIMFGGGMDMGKNRENINKIATAITNWLKNNRNEITPQNEKTDCFGQVKKLKELLDIGAITQEEFDLKKNQLLGL